MGISDADYEPDYRPAAAKRMPGDLYKTMVNGRLVAHEVGWDAYLEAFDPVNGFDEHERTATERDFPEASKRVRAFIESIEANGGLEHPGIVTKPANLPIAQRELGKLTELVDDFDAATKQAVDAIAALRAATEARGGRVDIYSPEWSAYNSAMVRAGELGHEMGETRHRLTWLLEFEAPYDEDTGEDADRGEDLDEDAGEQ